MLTEKDKAQLLRDAMELLQDADALIQQALGATDVCYETHNRIEDIVEDLRCDVMELDCAE
jgi:hypothetical protein